MSKIYKDILLDDDHDLIIENGTFKTGESLEQEVDLILLSKRGDWKQDPLLGPNLASLIKGPHRPEEFKSRIRLHMERDNKRVNRIEYNKGETNIDVTQE